jgi:hypothetical protein
VAVVSKRNNPPPTQPPLPAGKTPEEVVVVKEVKAFSGSMDGHPELSTINASSAYSQDAASIEPAASGILNTRDNMSSAVSTVTTSSARTESDVAARIGSHGNVSADKTAVLASFQAVLQTLHLSSAPTVKAADGSGKGDPAAVEQQQRQWQALVKLLADWEMARPALEVQEDMEAADSR